MPALSLTPAERRAHRAEAHHLSPVVLVGAGGLTAAVIGEADAALSAHGLIKVRFASDDRAERESALASLADRLDAAPVQHIGKLLVLWRPPAARPAASPAVQAAPRVVRVLVFPKSGYGRPTLKKLRVLGNQRVTAAGNVKRAKGRRASLKKSAGG